MKASSLGIQEAFTGTLANAHRRIELFAVEVSGRDLVTLVLERGSNRPKQRGVAVCKRMAVNDLDQHVLTRAIPIPALDRMLGTGDRFGIAVRENSYERLASETLHLLSHLAGGLGTAASGG